ncbi:MAG: PTS sugar transporter subunit IIA [Endomicrobia bacterium]|nr:PTS sugar transporter subunit IIA [Endomicrobiia bacterium]
MIKIVIIAHGGLAQELLNSAEMIAGKQPNVYALNRGMQDSLAQMQLKIDALLKDISDENGILILTDMIGGTPCNASVPMCRSFNTEILAGVNLPMVLSAIFVSKTAGTAAELSEKVLLDGQKSIINVKKMLLSRMK